ncbi:uncharacterized protein LOC143276293 [Babylonia areolata]|uniref:uncharacterized protein LOC143276293 n=1 Tax=Babylonia areolata TaxID=304850 RepID=UPI003FCF086F
MFSRLCGRSRPMCVQENVSGMFLIGRSKLLSQGKDKHDRQQNISKSVISQNNHNDNENKNPSEDVQRQKLQARALIFLELVDETTLSAKQLEIHRAHVRALKAGDMHYTDPETGYLVMTRLAHLHRGECCGNACRHCPFGQKDAPVKLRKTFNSAFYE